MEYAFHACNTMADTGICLTLDRMLAATAAPPVLLCIGSDLAVGDSLGPLVGTMVKKQCRTAYYYIYGTLRTPVTAKEVKYLSAFLKKTHPNSKIIAIDAAVGDESEVGLIKVIDGAIRPGAGANKRLPKVGDVSILGVVAKKSPLASPLLHLTRLGAVYRMADTIFGGLVALSDKLKEDRFVNKSQKFNILNTFPNENRVLGQ